VVIHDIRLISGQNLAYNDFSRGAALVEAGERAALAYLNAQPGPRASALARLLARRADLAAPTWRLARALPALLALLKAPPTPPEDPAPAPGI
jgi:hypothetical protein